MARAKVKLESRGIEAAMKSAEMHREINAVAERVAENVRAQNIRVVGIPGDIELPVKVTTGGETDRARASVALAHPSGKAVQAKHGALTKAAGQEGLEVRS